MVTGRDSLVHHPGMNRGCHGQSDFLTDDHGIIGQR
jgi:hypothetical protein